MPTPSIGVLLPHFGTASLRIPLTDAARLAEQCGFDSVWFRDHLLWRPHPQEPSSRNFLEAFVAMASVAATTERVTLGSAALIPHRHPIHSASLIGSLYALVGPGRLLLGWGRGGFGEEFTAIGMGGLNRGELLQEQLEAIRKLLSGSPVSHHGRHYRFDDVCLEVDPAAEATPMWYCGSGPRSYRWVARGGFDGWMASRMPRSLLAAGLGELQRTAEEHGRARPPVGVFAYLSPGRSVEEGWAALPVEGLRFEMENRYGLPILPTEASMADFEGTAIAGPPDVVAEEINRTLEVGVTHFVVDLRLRPDDWMECVQQLGDEVLPRLR